MFQINFKRNQNDFSQLLGNYSYIVIAVFLILFVNRANSQSVYSSSVEQSIFDFTVLYDTHLVEDPLSTPYSVIDEIRLLNRFKALTGINTDGILSRRKKLLNQNKINTNGFLKSGLEEPWNASLEVTYSIDKIRYHYALQSRFLYLLDSSFIATYNKFGLPVRTRSSLSYLSYELAPELTFGIGRFPMNWSLPGSQGLLLSNNFWPQDGFFLRHKTDIYKFEFFTGKINDLKSHDIRDNSNVEILAKRYIAMHRMMINVIPEKLIISISEAIIYGGEDAHFLPRYINPVNLYFISKQSDRWSDAEKNANPILGIDALYTLPSFKTKLYAQLVIDDIDFIPELTNVYPNRYAYSFSAIQSLKENAILKLSYRNISDWMYSSFYTWGNFTIHDDFLGNDKNGISEIKLEYRSSARGGLFGTSILYQNYKDQNVLELFDFNSLVERVNSRLITSVTFKSPLKNSNFWVESGFTYSYHNYDAQEIRLTAGIVTFF